MEIIIDIKKEKDLSGKECAFMNKYRRKYFGKDTKPKDFKREYPNSDFFFLKNERKRVVAFGILKPISIKYLGKKYNILGMANIIAVEHGKEYGRLIIAAMISHLRKKGKTGLGFCFPDISGFYAKCGLKVEKGFIQRFEYTLGKTLEERRDSEGDGLYLEGKDKFISKVLSNKDLVPIPIPFW